MPQSEFTTLYTAGDTLYAGAGNILYISRDGGESWSATNIIHPDADYVSAIIKAGSRLLVGTYNFGIFESRDGGNSWLPLNGGISGNGSDDIISFAQRGDSVYTGTDGSSIFVMNLNENTWSPFNQNIPMNISGSVYSLYNFNGRLVNGSGANAQIYINDHGKNEWEEIQFGAFNPQGTSLLAVAHLGGDLYGVGSQGIHKSTNGGLNWDFYDPGVGYISRASLLTNGASVFAMLSKSGSTYYFCNTGNNWQMLETQTGIITYGFTMAGNKIFAARPDGLYYRQMPLTPVKDRDNTVPRNFELVQNFPNPFNPETTIKYTITAQARVVIKVYDTTGNEIKTLIDREHTAGQYAINFNASGLASGVYYYRLMADDYTSTKKMILLK